VRGRLRGRVTGRCGREAGGAGGEYASAAFERAPAHELAASAERRLRENLT